MMSAVPAIALEETIYEMLGVRILSDLGREQGNAFPRARSASLRRIRRWHWQGTARGRTYNGPGRSPREAAA